MRRKKSVLPLSIVSSFLLAASMNGAFADEGNEGAPVPPKYTGVFIENISYKGSGCREGTMESVISNDHRTMALLFNDFGLLADGQMTGKRNTKCNIQITVDVPPEYAVALSSVDLRGSVLLPKGAGGSLKSRFFMSGKKLKAGVYQNWFNDEQDWLIENFNLSPSFSEEGLGEEDLVFSKCGENAVIDIKTKIKRFSNEGVMLGTVQVRSMDNALGIEYEWRECAM